MNWEPDRIPRKRLDSRTRVAGGEVTIGDAQQIFVLNGSAGDIWRRIDGRKTFDELERLLIAEYSIDAETAREALIATVEPLLEVGLISIVDRRSGR